jgi:hypothetical protein
MNQGVNELVHITIFVSFPLLLSNNENIFFTNRCKIIMPILININFLWGFCPLLRKRGIIVCVNGLTD